MGKEAPPVFNLWFLIDVFQLYTANVYYSARFTVYLSGEADIVSFVLCFDVNCC